MKEELWIGLVWVKPLPQAPTALDGAAGAFVNIVTWACDFDTYRKKSEKLAAAHELYVVNIEDAEPVAVRLSRSTVGDEIAKLIARAELNRNFILFGTFHEYPYEDA